MSGSSVLGIALAGLNVTRTGLEVVAENIANADSPGYTRKSVDQEAMAANGQNSGVLIRNVERDIDILIQRQLRGELSGQGYTSTLARYLDQLDTLFGQPGSVNAPDTIYNGFQSSIQALSTSPDSFAAREQVINDAQVLAQSLNQMTAEIQRMRQIAEASIGDAVDRVNGLLQGLADINQEIIAAHSQQGPQQLTFDERSLFDANALYSKDPTERGVGTITLSDQNGFTMDLIADGTIRSGELRALIDLRATMNPPASM